MVDGQLCVPWAQGGWWRASSVLHRRADRARGTHGWLHLTRHRHIYAHRALSVPVALAGGRRGVLRTFQGLVSARSNARSWGLPWPSASRHPQDSQTDIVIGRRQDIPRETHLHAWVTPAAACFLTLREIRVGSLLWEDGAGFHGNRSCLLLAWKGRKKAGRNRRRKISSCGAVPPVR